ncbi:MAG: MATE family efflux transporter [Bacillota bacterium]|nr:MATE family efflux transporter [Bacillota bacterium]
MIQTYSKKEKLISLLSILIPILITQISLMAMGFFDTTMSGHYSPSDLAGVAIGSSLWVPVFTGINGILLAITPIVSHLVGAKKNEKVAFSVIQGLYLAIVIAIIVTLIGGFILNPILNGMKLEVHVQKVSHDYLVALSIGMVPLFAYNVLRSFIDALGKTRVTMIITLSSLPVNILFNYFFIYGKFGFPELGGVGSGYATAITYWIISLFTIYIIHTKKPFSHFSIFKHTYRLSFSKWREILKIGVPIGFSIFFETSIFAAVTLLMSNFSTNIIASHQSALNFSSILYMLPLSISMALTILVGYEVGANRLTDAKEYSLIGIGLAVLLAVFCGAILLFFRTNIAALYTNDPIVLRITSHFLLYALFFQFSDAIQAPVQGSLRGYKDVNVTFIMTLISYWVIGLPVGYLMAIYTSLGAFGYWIGLITGLAVGAFLLLSRLFWIQKRNLYVKMKA